MRRHYSRLASVEEKRNIRSAFLYGLLTIGFLAFLLYFGLPTMARFAGFIGDIKKGERPVDKNDTTPPAPPRFTSLPEATNELTLDIEGEAEAGATITVFINDKTEEVLSNSEGKFSLDAKLNQGKNTISGKAVDSSGNEGQKSQVYTVIFDNEKPNLDISSPTDGANFYGSKQRQMTIKGKTEEGVSLTVNDRLISVLDDGSFSYPYPLGDGENILNFKAFDKAGNLTEENVTVNFTP